MLSSWARAGSEKSAVTWIWAVTVAPALDSSDNSASRSAGSAVSVVISTTVAFGRVPRTARAPIAPANFSSPFTRSESVSFCLVRSSRWVLSEVLSPWSPCSSGELILVAPSTMPSASARKIAASETM